MANRDAPAGFSPDCMLTGGKIPVLRFGVDASNDTAVYIGDLIGADTDGKIEVADADEAGTLLGACVGVYDANGVSCGAPNSLSSKGYLAATTAGYVDVALALPGAVFRCQADTAGTAPAATDVFSSANHVAGTGSTVTCRSGHELDASDLAGVGQAQFRVIGKVDEPNNAWGEHVQLRVVPGESYWMPIASAGI